MRRKSAVVESALISCRSPSAISLALKEDLHLFAALREQEVSGLNGRGIGTQLTSMQEELQQHIAEKANLAAELQELREALQVLFIFIQSLMRIDTLINVPFRMDGRMTPRTEHV